MATKTKKPASKKTAKKAAPKKTVKPVEAIASTTEPKPTKKVAKAKPTETKLSALDAAAKVLAASTEPLNTKQMIEQMAAKKLWTSPGGKTPHATLYSALLREIQTKGKDARFKKTERGHFAVNG